MLLLATNNPFGAVTMHPGRAATVSERWNAVSLRMDQMDFFQITGKSHAHSTSLNRHSFEFATYNY